MATTTTSTIDPTLPVEHPPDVYPKFWEGTCKCTQVAWDSNASDGLEVGICYCDNCTRQTGSDRSTFFLIDKCSLTFRGPIRCFTKDSTRKKAGGLFYQIYFYHCSNCGTAIAHENELDDGIISMHIGTWLPRPDQKIDEAKITVWHWRNRLRPARGTDTNHSSLGW